METITTKSVETPFQSTHKGFLVSQAAIRTLGVVATLIATVLMSTSKETTQIYGIQMEAKYSYSPAFKFSVAVNSAACFFAVLSFLVFFYSNRLPNPSQKIYFTMFVLDLMVMICIITGSSAATAIGYLGRYGNSHAGWIAICDNFSKFCGRIMASLILSYVAALFFLVLTIWSSWTTASKATKVQVLLSEIDTSLKKRENKIGNGCDSAP